MTKFRKKPVVVEARQYTGEERNTVALYEWIHDVELSSVFGVASAQIMAECAERGGLMIPTMEGNMLASKGDWIIRGVKGEFYPCKPDVFAATYEPVDETKKESVDAPFRAEYLLNKLAAKMEVANITFMRRNDNWVLLGCTSRDIYGAGVTVIDCLNDAVSKGNL